MTAATIDHVALGLSRVAAQYQNSPNFLAYISALMAQSQDVERAFLQIATIADIDASVGVQLDVLGQIVGISRYVKDSLPVAFMGWDSQPGARSLGEEGLADIGARLRDENESESSTNAASDAQYRLFLRARIARNHTTGTVESVQNALRYVFGAEIVIVDDKNNMSFDISVGKRLSYTEQVLLYLLAIIPKPAGVRIATRSFFDPNFTFGFEGSPWALTFGDENQRHAITRDLLLGGDFSLDGSEELDGLGVGAVVYDSPLTGGVFAEEFSIAI